MPLIMARPHSRGQVTYRSRVLEMLLTQGRKDSNGCGASNAVRSMTFCGLQSELMTICRTCKNTQTMLSRKASGQAINTRTRIQHMELQQEVSILPMTKSTVLGRVRALSFMPPTTKLRKSCLRETKGCFVMGLYIRVIIYAALTVSPT